MILGGVTGKMKYVFLRFDFFCVFLVSPVVQPECEVSRGGPSFRIGGGVTGREPMGSDCDHEGSLATWLWSSIDDRISSS